MCFITGACFASGTHLLNAFTQWSFVEGWRLRFWSAVSLAAEYAIGGQVLQSQCVSWSFEAVVLVFCAKACRFVICLECLL